MLYTVLEVIKLDQPIRDRIMNASCPTMRWSWPPPGHFSRFVRARSRALCRPRARFSVCLLSHPLRVLANLACAFIARRFNRQARHRKRTRDRTRCAGRERADAPDDATRTVQCRERERERERERDLRATCSKIRAVRAACAASQHTTFTLPSLSGGILPEVCRACMRACVRA